MDSATVRMTVPDGVDPRLITGAGDAVLRALERRSGVRIAMRGDTISLRGASGDVELIARTFSHLIDEASAGRAPSADDALRTFEGFHASGLAEANFRDDVLFANRGKAIRPKTVGQKRYADAMRANTITFCLGPAGTGKTYLAMAMAVDALKRRDVSRIVLTRPVVEAGESLGFLPGTLQEKIDPYVRPLFDALIELVGTERADELVERGVVEIAPLAYMRGRTLNDVFAVLDEAQNTTPEQMKMFLTRLGFNSRFVITGDTTQRDLVGRADGLDDIEEILAGVRDIAFIHLDRADVVRHELVGRIVEAYDAFEASHDGRASSRGGVVSHRREEDRA